MRVRLTLLMVEWRTGRDRKVCMKAHRVSDAGEMSSKAGRVYHSRLEKGGACE